VTVARTSDLLDRTARAGRSGSTPARRGGGRSAAGLAALGAAAGAGAAWVTHEGLIDDTYITLAYARNVAEDGHWGLVPGQTANSATSPLNVLLLALSMRVVSLLTGTSRPVVALGLLTVVLGAALGWWLARSAAQLRLSWLWPAAGVAVVLANPFVLSALGLEVVLLSALLAGLLAAGLRGRPVAYGVLSGLAVLARLDLVVFVLAVALLSAPVRRRLLVAAGTAVAVSLPWFAWSWWVLGSAIPDTFVIKTLQRSFGESVYLTGLWTHYVPMNAVAVGVSVVPALLGLVVALLLAVASLRRGRERGAWGAAGHGPLLGLAVGGVLYYAVYSLMGVPPYQWYYVPPQVSLALVAVLGGGLLLRAVAGRAGAVLAVAVLVLAPLGLLASLDGRSLPWATPPIFGNFATAADYQAAGRGLAEAVGDERVASPGEIGTLAFACRCEIVDAFADRDLVAPLVEQRTEEAGPVLRALLELNYARLETEPAAPVEHRLVWVPATDQTPGPSWPTGSPQVGPGRLVLLDG
jgi:hypothetical protein